MHLNRRLTYISEISLERFIGKGCLLYTDHSMKYGTDDYYKEHPVVRAEAFMARVIACIEE